MALAAFGAIGSVQAGAIVSATSATINSGGPGFGSINDTLNQNGLNSGYVSGVTDFDTYIGSNPSHSSQFSGFEWFSNQGSSSASVTYNLGSSMSINAVALWNEEAAGIGSLNLLYSTDGINFTSLASNLNPTDNPPFPAPYFADVFAFGAVTAQYIRFDASACPQQPAGFDSCAIGEVAFRQGNAVPEPSSAALAGFALLMAGAARRRALRA